MAFRTYSPRGSALAAHMNASLARQAPVGCRHCGALGCACGQKEAAAVVAAARSLSLPEGTALAEVEASNMRGSLPIGVLTRAAIEGVALAADQLAAHWRLGRRETEALACVEVARTARAAAKRMP
jgi:hypothetical protein